MRFMIDLLLRDRVLSVTDIAITIAVGERLCTEHLLGVASEAIAGSAAGRSLFSRRKTKMGGRGQSPPFELAGVSPLTVMDRELLLPR